jgi:hypothetical protein
MANTRIAQRQDLRIDCPVEEELLAAGEYALEWFEQWERHANHENDFGGEHAGVSCATPLPFPKGASSSPSSL